MKYVLTLWTDWYDFDGLTQDFKVLLETKSRLEALNQATSLLENLVEEELSKPRTYPWLEEYFASSKRPGCGACPRTPPNANNVVIESFRRKVGDGTKYSSTYYYLDVVELPDNSTVGPEIFGDSYEVLSYFSKDVFATAVAGPALLSKNTLSDPQETKPRETIRELVLRTAKTIGENQKKPEAPQC